MLNRFAFSLITAGLILASCSHKNEYDGTQGPVIHLWTSELQGPTDSLLTVLLDDFEAANQCSVAVHTYSNTQVNTFIDSVRAPGRADVIISDISSIAKLADAKCLLPVANPDSTAALFLPGSMQALKWKGAIVALPWLVDTRIIFVNPTAIPSLSTLQIPSQDALLEVCEQIGSQNTTGWATHGEDPGRMIYSILPFLWSYGGNIAIRDSTVFVNLPANVRALTQYVELSRTGKLETERQLDAEFMHGSIGMWFGSSSLIGECSQSGHSRHASAMLLPGGGTNKGTSVITGTAIGVVSSSPQQVLAVKLQHHLTSDASLRALTASIQSPFPSRLSVLTKLRSTSQGLRAVACDQLLNAQSIPAHPKWPQIARMIEQFTLKVVYGELQPEEALQRLQQQLSELVAS